MKQKLIDANEFAIEEPKLWDWSSIDGISSTAVLKQCIWDVQCAPTVKAIPIEWIKKYVAEEGIYPNRELLSVEQAVAIERMIENWEKENEIVGAEVLV